MTTSAHTAAPSTPPISAPSPAQRRDRSEAPASFLAGLEQDRRALLAMSPLRRLAFEILSRVSQGIGALAWRLAPSEWSSDGSNLGTGEAESGEVTSHVATGGTRYFRYSYEDESGATITYHGCSYGPLQEIPAENLSVRKKLRNLKNFRIEEISAAEHAAETEQVRS